MAGVTNEENNWEEILHRQHLIVSSFPLQLHQLDYSCAAVNELLTNNTEIYMHLVRMQLLLLDR